MTKIIIILIIIILLVSAGAVAYYFWSNKSEKKAGDVNTFQKALEADDFIVQEGKFVIFDILKMADQGLIPSCYGNNPSTPYIVHKLPLAPGQTTKNTVTDAAIEPEDEGLWTDYRLRPDEAIVLIANTPPEADYFSYRSYLAMRYFPTEQKQKRIFASLGDTINNTTINTTSPEVYNSPIMIITTADQKINDRIHRAALAAGFSGEIINDDIIPADLVNMGLEEEADTFNFLHRVAFFKDKNKGNDYMNNPPAQVFRITPQKETTDLKPQPVPDLRVRGTGDTKELDLNTTLAELRQAIIDKHSDLEATDLETSLWLFEGYDAIQRGIDVIGENRDTSYLQTNNFTLADDPDEFVIVYGVNHAATGKATYSNFSIYGQDMFNGIGAVSNHDFTGTAHEYLPDNPNAKYFYVWKVARQVGDDQHTLGVPYNQGTKGIDLDEQAFLTFRAYLEPATKVGPFWGELLYDRAVKFSSQ